MSVGQRDGPFVSVPLYTSCYLDWNIVPFIWKGCAGEAEDPGICCDEALLHLR